MVVVVVARSFKEGRHERPPYTRETLRTVYYVRELEVFKLAQVRFPFVLLASLSSCALLPPTSRPSLSSSFVLCCRVSETVVGTSQVYQHTTTLIR